MKIVLTGATGFVGRQLALYLVGQGADVHALCRNAGRGRSLLGREITCVDLGDHAAVRSALNGADVVYHLAGANIFRPWTRSYQGELLTSRVGFLQDLATISNSCEAPPRRLVCANAIGYYGDRGDAVLDESQSAGSGFVARLCEKWQEAALAFPAQQVSVVRLGIVLGHGGGYLDNLLPSVRSGLATVLGDGEQYVSWIHLQDAVRVLAWAGATPDVPEVVHATAPTPVTQREMVGQLAQHLGRPQFLRVPRVALSPLGEFRGLLLDSQRVVPNAAMNRGFKFLYATLNEALQDLLGEFSGARGQAGHVEADQDLPASPAAVWDFLCDPANVAVVTPLSMQAQLRQVPDRIEAGATLKVAVAVAGVALPWELQVTQYSPGESFVDSQIHGPFYSWRHRHEVAMSDLGCLMRDSIDYALLPAAVSWIDRAVARVFVEPRLRSMFAFRRQAFAARFAPIDTAMQPEELR